MKKTKLLKSLVGLSALSMPALTVLTATGCSCSGINYFQLAKKFKTTAIQEFINLSKCPRNTWLEGPAYDYIVERMNQLGYSPAGYDDFGSREEVVAAAQADLTDPIKYDKSWNKYGNIWFDIPASEGCQKWPKVILHAHMDVSMVFKEGEQTPQIYSDWKQNGIDAYYDQDQQIMYSNGNKTSLGADCGIGCAELLSIATHANDDDFKHGPIRLLFTADESGAVNIDLGDAHYEYQSGAALLAEDQELFEEGEYKDRKKPFDTNLIIDLDGYQQTDVMRSCAGIHECIFNNDHYKPENVNWEETLPDGTTRPRREFEVKVEITRPQGASSGTDANKGYANALKVLGDTIVEWDEETPKGYNPVFQLVEVQSEGGAYSICPAASAKYISYLTPEMLQNKLDEFTEMYENAYPKERGKIKISYSEITGSERATKAIDLKSSRDICCLLNILEFGPVTWFDNQRTKVKTSYNVGPLTVAKVDDDNWNVNFHVVSRSSDQLQQIIFTKRIHNYFNYFLEIDPESEKTFTDIENDVWESSPNNKMANFIFQIKKNFKYQPVMADIHAWAEMSQFPAIIRDSLGKEAYMASIGCTITGVHSRQETLYVATMDSLLKTLIYALMNIERM